MLALLFAAGAIVNVAVAWGVVCWSPSASNHGRLNGCEWTGTVPRDWPTRPQMRAAFDGIGYREDLALWSRQPRSLASDTSYWQLTERAGLPLRSLGVVRNVAHAAFTDPAAAQRRSLADGLSIPSWIPFIVRRGWRSLPLQTIWPGFAINTLFYASILWMLFAAPFALRKRRRIKRGLCTKCGYNLRGSPHPNPLAEEDRVSVCPECGTARACYVGRRALASQR